jgi:hypothetical protein
LGNHIERYNNAFGRTHAVHGTHVENGKAPVAISPSFVAAQLLADRQTLQAVVGVHCLVDFLPVYDVVSPIALGDNDPVITSLDAEADQLYVVEEEAVVQHPAPQILQRSRRSH